MSQKNLERNSSLIVQQLVTTSHAEEKPYVFISYASDDWKIVLEDIVRPLEESGLRVYYDKAFGTRQENWITQFTDNMESEYCVAMLSFLSPSYFSSYATLMELIHSQGRACGVGHRLIRKKPIIPIVISPDINVTQPEQFLDSPTQSVGLPLLPNMERNKFNKFYANYLENNKANPPEHKVDIAYLETLYPFEEGCQKNLSRKMVAKMFACIYEAIAPNYLYFHNYKEEDKSSFFHSIIEQLTIDGVCSVVGEPVLFQETATTSNPPKKSTPASRIPIEKRLVTYVPPTVSNPSPVLPTKSPTKPPTESLNPLEKLQRTVSEPLPVSDITPTVENSQSDEPLDPMEKMRAVLGITPEELSAQTTESDMSLFQLHHRKINYVKEYLDTTVVNLVIPEGVEGILDGAFTNCKSLQSILFPSSLKVVETQALKGCTTLNSVTFQEGLDAINGGAFQDCINLKEVVLPNSLHSLEYSCFQGCTALERIVFPEDLKSIPKYCCSDCTSLPFVHLPKKAEHIGSNAFSNCTSLENIELPSDIFDLDFQALYKTPWEEEQYKLQSSFVIIGASVLIQCQLPKDNTHIEIPDGVLVITENAFENRPQLSSVTIPESVLWISGSAFSFCLNLQEVNLPSSLIKIGVGVFFHCYALTSLTLPPSLKELGATAFASCKNLRSIEIPEAVTQIPNKCFSQCVELESVSLLGVKEIKEQAFYNCKKLRTIHFSDSLEKIGASAFYACESLETVKFPNSLKSLDTALFDDCKQLTTVYLPPSIEEITGRIFSKDSQLKSCIVVKDSYAHKYCISRELPWSFE